jgi:thioredoxin 1
MALDHYDKDSFDQKVLKSDKLVLVDFFATWCGPCKMATPVIEELADEYKDKLVAGKVDVGEEQELAGQYGVMSIPTVILFKGGEEVDRMVGFPGKDGYEQLLKKHL